MADDIWRYLYGDKDYISGTLERELADKGMILVTSVKKKHEIQSDETLEPPDAPTTIYY